MRWGILGIISALVLGTSAAVRAEGGWSEFGVRAGWSFSDNREDFQLYEVYGSYDTPWVWRPGRWLLKTRFDAGLGALDGGGETGLTVAAGPRFTFYAPGGLLALDIGLRPTFVSEHRYGRTDLGGAVQFTSHGGVSLLLGQRVALGYRLSHMSNAGIYRRNPGVNLHMLELSYRY